MNRRDFLKCSLGMALGAVLGCGDSNEHHGSLFIRPYEEFQKIVEERKLGTLEQTANELEGFRLTAGFSGKEVKDSLLQTKIALALSWHIIKNGSCLNIH